MFKVEFYDVDDTISHNATVGSLEELAEMAEGRMIKIVGRGEYCTDEALIVVKAYGEDFGLPGMLEILQAMKVDGNLKHHQQRAFNHVFNGFRRLFHGDAS